MGFLKENIVNRSRIMTMARMSVREEFRGTKLGFGWEAIRTIVFFTVYILFRLFIRKGGDVGALEAIMEITSVILPFQYVTAVINQTPKIYHKRKELVTTINFPASIIPTFDIISKFIIHLFAIALIFVVFVVLSIFTDQKVVGFNYLGMIYYYLALTALLLSMMMTLSLVCSVSRDMYKLWQVITKIFIYINPIFWKVSTIVKMAKKAFGPTAAFWVEIIIKANPFVYIFEGVRNCMVHHAWIDYSWYALYFWGITLVLYAIGAKFQEKVGKILPDIL